MAQRLGTPPPPIPQMPLWRSGSGGYHTYRIPALAVTPEGALLAFCEGRRDSRSDYGQIDLLVRRSTDGGRTWSPPQVAVREEGMTCGNPTPVVDAESGTVWLPFCKNLADGGEDDICRGRAPRTVWLTHSADGGATWAEPVEITAQVKDPRWTWYATGPCHGVQLTGGRLLVPCDHVVGVQFDRYADPHHSHVIYSDDGGATWHVGGILPEGSNECAVVEAAPGRVYINCRNKRGVSDRRAFAWSDDGGLNFHGFGRDEALVEPLCQGSLARHVDEVGRVGVLFANPASTERRNLTVRLSEDGCRTWPASRTLHAGPAAYSDLAVLPDGTVCCLYERGGEGPYEELALARLDLAWLTASPAGGA